MHKIIGMSVEEQEKNNYHWKLQLLNEGMNRASTLGFRCVYDV